MLAAQCAKPNAQEPKRLQASKNSAYTRQTQRVSPRMPAALENQPTVGPQMHAPPRRPNYRRPRWAASLRERRDSAALVAKTAHSGRSRSHKIKRKWTAVRAAVSLKLSCCLRRYPMETRLAYHCASEALAKLVKRALSLSCLLICYVYVAWASCLRHKPAGSQKTEYGRLLLSLLRT